VCLFASIKKSEDRGYKNPHWVYYESMERKLLKPVYECRCNGRLQTKRFTRLTHTGSVIKMSRKNYNERTWLFFFAGCFVHHFDVSLCSVHHFEVFHCVLILLFFHLHFSSSFFNHLVSASVCPWFHFSQNFRKTSLFRKRKSESLFFPPRTFFSSWPDWRVFRQNAGLYRENWKSTTIKQHSLDYKTKQHSLDNKNNIKTTYCLGLVLSHSVRSARAECATSGALPTAVSNTELKHVRGLSKPIVTADPFVPYWHTALVIAFMLRQTAW
jgi:hypothetical protein